MIEFQEAIAIASDNAKNLIRNARNLEVEGVVLSDNDKLYEVTLSFDMHGADPLDIEDGSKRKDRNDFQRLVTILSHRREYKTFLVDAGSGKFKGFKIYKEK